MGLNSSQTRRDSILCHYGLIGDIYSVLYGNHTKDDTKIKFKFLTPSTEVKKAGTLFRSRTTEKIKIGWTNIHGQTTKPYDRILPEYRYWAYVIYTYHINMMKYADNTLTYYSVLCLNSVLWFSIYSVVRS